MINKTNMNITIRTNRSDFKYKYWQLNLAWLLVFLCGLFIGITVCILLNFK